MNLKSFVLVSFLGASVWFTGCGVKVSSRSNLPASPPVSFSAATTSLSDDLSKESPPEVSGFSANSKPALAISNANGRTYGAVINSSGDLTIAEASTIRSSLQNISRSVHTLGDLNQLLIYVSGMEFAEDGSRLFILETAKTNSSIHPNSGVVYTIDTLNGNKVTHFDLGSEVDLPMGIAYVSSAQEKLYFSSKSGGQGQVYEIDVAGGTPTLFTDGLEEPTGIATDGVFLYIYDIHGANAKIYRAPLEGNARGIKEEFAGLAIKASPAAQPMAISRQENFKSLFYVDGSSVKLLDLSKSTSVDITATVTGVLTEGKLKEVSGIGYSSTDSVLFIGSIAEGKVIFGRASS